jgi:hypothetical protein
MNGMLFFMLAGVLVVACIVLWVMFRLSHNAQQLNVEKYRRRWLEVEQMLDRNDQRSCQFAIIEADKMLDIAMKESGVGGETMGERLKTAKHRWSDQNGLWTAHKLRNQIVHEADIKVGYDTTRRALASFKKALKDMGAI